MLKLPELKGSKKQKFLDSLSRDNTYYFFVGGAKKGEKGKDLGYVSSSKTLLAKVVSFAQQHGYTELHVSWGENIMNVDEGFMKFTVSVTIS